MLTVFETFSGISFERTGCDGLGGVNDWHAMQFKIYSNNLFM